LGLILVKELVLVDPEEGLTAGGVSLSFAVYVFLFFSCKCWLLFFSRVLVNPEEGLTAGGVVSCFSFLVWVSCFASRCGLFLLF
jgi:hypothetical protein